jgi:CHAT domain-containing protein
MKDYMRAIKGCEEALKLDKRLVSSDNLWHYVDINRLLIYSYIKMGRIQEAQQLLSKMETELENLGNPAEKRFSISLTKAELLREMGKDPTEPLNEAIVLLEKIRPTSGSNADYSFWEEKLSIYNEIVDLLYKKGDYAQALEMAEKARSRRFLDYLGSKKLSVKTTSSYMLLQQADAILESLTNIENDMVNAAQAAGIKARTVYEEGTRYTQQLETYRGKLKALTKSDQQYGAIHNITPPSPKEVQKKLPADVTVLEYYLTDSALYAWVLDQKNIHLVKQDISEKELRDLVIAFRSFMGTDALKRDLTMIKRVSKEAGETEEKLYARLISPVQKYITTQKICIVPYGILNYLPFQALYDGEKYLVERYAISYLPSLSVLEFLGKREKKEQYKVLAFGNPDLRDQALDLPAAEKEVMEISSIYPGVQVFKREKATKGLLKKLSNQYDIIHFACHGQYVPEAPLASCIRLAPENGDDGRLEANEIFDMDMKADLIVTSACQTAIGQIGKGDEVVGLTRAFLYAGASSVLGSLWSISDEATSLFMKEFYTDLKKWDKAEALRQAQVKMIRSKEYSSPFYWAAFNLTGSF